MQKIIIAELENVIKKYAIPRKTGIVYDAPVSDEPDDPTPDYAVSVFVTQEGYLKKITPQSLRMSGEQKFKEGDGISQRFEATNHAELLVFTNRQQVYKARLRDFDDSKASVLGEFLPAKLGMDEGESVVSAVLPGDYGGYVLFAFENGKCSKVPLASYATKTNRRRLTGAYGDKSPLMGMLHLPQEAELVIHSSDGRALVCSSAQISEKSTRSTQGIQVLTPRRGRTLVSVALLEQTALQNLPRYRAKTLPSAGAVLRPEDAAQPQMTLDALMPDK